MMYEFAANIDILFQLILVAIVAATKVLSFLMVVSLGTKNNNT